METTNENQKLYRMTARLVILSHVYLTQEQIEDNMEIENPTDEQIKAFLAKDVDEDCETFNWDVIDGKKVHDRAFYDYFPCYEIEDRAFEELCDMGTVKEIKDEIDAKNKEALEYFDWLKENQKELKRKFDNR